MSDSTYTAASSPASDSVENAGGSGYVPSGMAFAEFMTPSIGGHDGGSDAGSSGWDGNVSGVAAPDAEDGEQAYGSGTEADSYEDWRDVGDREDRGDRAGRTTEALESDDVSALPLHLQERGRQIIEQKNRYRQDAEALREQWEQMSAFLPMIEQLQAEGYRSAEDIQAAFLEQLEPPYADAEAADDDGDTGYPDDPGEADGYGDAYDGLSEEADGEPGDERFAAPAMAEAAQAALAYEQEIRRRELAAQQMEQQAQAAWSEVEHRYREQQYDAVLGQAFAEAPILREFARDDGVGMGLGELLLDELRLSGQYHPEQIAGMAHVLGERLSAALTAMEDRVAARYAARLGEKAAAAPETLGAGGGVSPATGAPANYRPTGGNFTRWLMGPRRTL